MPRVKRGTKRRNSRKKTLTLAKGFFLTKSKLYRSAQEAVEKSLAWAKEQGVRVEAVVADATGAEPA